MESKYNEITKTLDSKYFSFNFPNLSPDDIEDLKGNIMAETQYIYDDIDVTFMFIAKKNQINILIMTESFKINLFLDIKSFLQQLDKIAENYQESEEKTEYTNSDDITDTEEYGDESIGEESTGEESTDEDD
jgi:hypothetical protein